MNNKKLYELVSAYASGISAGLGEYEKDLSDRRERKAFYQSWTRERLTRMSEEDFTEYLSRLWAMRIWGNKEYAINKIVEGNGLAKVRSHLADLLWGDSPLENRWDKFRSEVKGMGPAMMSELLCHTHPEDCILWNRRAYVGLEKLGVENLPRYEYQLDGKRYLALSAAAKEIAVELKAQGLPDTDLLAVDYFIWDELQDETPLEQMHKKPKQKGGKAKLPKPTDDVSEFIHNDIRDKLEQIGYWLGFETETEKKVADGARVDTVWELSVRNMGRIIYVFEVQTKGNLDSLALNLLKSLNNPAVQGVVAVSDAEQIPKIKKHAAAVPGLADKLKYWDYQDVLRVHESLAQVNESILGLGLVPQSFTLPK